MPGVPPARYAYLGPAGTFSEQALCTVPAARASDAVPCSTVPAALEAVRRGDVDFAMVPIENSVEGSVNVTLDELAGGDPLRIVREVALPIRFALLARPGTSLSSVRAVGSHPHALAQCRRWVADQLPGTAMLEASSTSAAAEAVAAGTAGFEAALSAGVAAERYRLQVLADGINDNDAAVTRFVLVTRPKEPGSGGDAQVPTGHDKTSLVAYIHDDHPGALLEILTEFAVRGVNLTRIESRPTGDKLGDYHFSIDCEGHVLDERVGEALMGLRRVCADVRFLGSYERADGIAPSVRRGTTDLDFRDAHAWLSRIRGR